MTKLLTTLLLTHKYLKHSDLSKNNLLPYLLPLTTLYINICKLLHLTYKVFLYINVIAVV